MPHEIGPTRRAMIRMHNATKPRPPPSSDATLPDGRPIIRSGSGLGDQIYLQSVVRHLVEKGKRPHVLTSYPQLFTPIADKITIGPFVRQKAAMICHYTGRKGIDGTDQWQDCCLSAGFTEPIELRIDWTPTNKLLVDEVTRSKKPIVCVQLPRTPMNRTDGFGAELLPDCSVLQRAINVLKPHATIVQIGSGAALHRFSGIDIDLANKTSISDLLDVASVASAFLGFVSFIVPLAESLSKPCMLVWSQRGLDSAQGFIRHIHPKKILHRASSKWVVDSWEPARIDAAFKEFAQGIA